MLHYEVEDMLRRRKDTVHMLMIPDALGVEMRLVVHSTRKGETFNLRHATETTQTILADRTAEMTQIAFASRTVPTKSRYASQRTSAAESSSSPTMAASPTFPPA